MSIDFRFNKLQLHWPTAEKQKTTNDPSVGKLFWAAWKSVATIVIYRITDFHGMKSPVEKQECLVIVLSRLDFRVQEIQNNYPHVSVLFVEQLLVMDEFEP